MFGGKRKIDLSKIYCEEIFRQLANRSLTILDKIELRSKEVSLSLEKGLEQQEIAMEELGNALESYELLVEEVHSISNRLENFGVPYEFMNQLEKTAQKAKQLKDSKNRGSDCGFLGNNSLVHHQVYLSMLRIKETNESLERFMGMLKAETFEKSNKFRIEYSPMKLKDGHGPPDAIDECFEHEWGVRLKVVHGCLGIDKSFIPIRDIRLKLDSLWK